MSIGKLVLKLLACIFWGLATLSAWLTPRLDTAIPGGWQGLTSAGLTCWGISELIP